MRALNSRVKCNGQGKQCLVRINILLMNMGDCGLKLDQEEPHSAFYLSAEWWSTGKTESGEGDPACQEKIKISVR